MSRELVQKYPDIYQYTGIWMEDITHTTARGSTPFTLSSTNKLLKQYQWAHGAEKPVQRRRRNIVCLQLPEKMG